MEKQTNTIPDGMGAVTLMGKAAVTLMEKDAVTLPGWCEEPHDSNSRWDGEGCCDNDGLGKDAVTLVGLGRVLWH